jgi:trk system potassium uptake protein TrkH
MRSYSSFRPELWLVFGFLSLIAAGALALWSIGILKSMPIDFLDALFTSTSAVCVTGLSTIDIGRDLPTASQVVLLMLIQIGGLGVMTATTAFAVVLGARISIKERLIWAGSMGLDTPQGAVKLLIRVFVISLFAEALMSVPLFLGFLQKEPVGRAAYMAVFHSISAFCNAGFSPYSDSLVGFSGNFRVMIPITFLIVIGGMGFPVIDDVIMCVKLRRWRPSPYSKVVLKSTFWLIVLGALLLFLSEFNGAMRGMPFSEKVMNAVFHSVTPRTAGFNSLPMTSLSGLSLVFTVFLMWVGASPSSTGGGIKTTTLAVLWASCVSEVRGLGEVRLEGRSVDSRFQRKALTVAMLYTLAIFIAVCLLTVFEPLPTSALIFEAFSAMGTVGLSLGITSKLTPEGKLILILLMYWGRVGIVTFMYSLFRRHVPGRVLLPSINMPIG